MTADTIASYYERDHDRLDSLFKQFQTLKHSNFEQAKTHFREFNFGLRKHIVWEEEILFPLFEAKTGMKDSGPTAVMRIEHREVHEALEAIHDKVRNRHTDSDEDEARLLRVFTAHNEKEESILYPMIDRLATEEERKDIFKKMSEYPEGSSSHCCCGH